MTSNISIVCANWASSLGLNVLAMRTLFFWSRYSGCRTISAAGHLACSKLAASLGRSGQYGKFPLPGSRFALIIGHLCPILTHGTLSQTYETASFALARLRDLARVWRNPF